MDPRLSDHLANVKAANLNIAGTVKLPGVPEIQAPPSVTPDLRIELDWRAYWKEFQRVHGGDPVFFEKKFLFRDGWMHSATDYAGPEWAPPEDDPKRVRFLQYTYWELRSRMVMEEMRYLDNLIHNLSEVQRARSAPLQQVVRFRDEEGRIRIERKNLDLTLLVERLKLLKSDFEDCQARMKALADDAKTAQVEWQAIQR